MNTRVNKEHPDRVGEQSAEAEPCLVGDDIETIAASEGVPAGIPKCEVNKNAKSYNNLIKFVNPRATVIIWKRNQTSQHELFY